MLVLQNCDNPGSVGRSFGPRDASLHIDTIPVPGMTTATLKAYSGNLQFASAGTYQNPLFGTYQAIGLLQPVLLPQTDSIGANASFTLRLKLGGITGDTTAVSTFELVEITRRWRATTWTLDSIPQVEATYLSTFTVTNKDSVDIDIPPSWKNRYLAYQRSKSANRDTLYLNGLYGFAIRGVGSDKIIAINVGTSVMRVVQNDSTLTNKAAIFRQSANSVAHTPSAMVLPNDVTIIGSDFRRAGKFNLVFSESFIGAKLPNRVELAMIEDSLTMKANTPPGHVWMDQFQVPVYILEDFEITLAIFNAPTLFVNRNPNGTYRSNLTTFYNGVLRSGGQTGSLYFLSHRFNGIIRPRLFYNTNSTNNRPRVIVTTFRENRP